MRGREGLLLSVAMVACGCNSESDSQTPSNSKEVRAAASLVAAGNSAEQCVETARSLIIPCRDLDPTYRPACLAEVSEFAETCVAESYQKIGLCREVISLGHEQWLDNYCSKTELDAELCRQGLARATKGCRETTAGSSCLEARHDQAECVALEAKRAKDPALCEVLADMHRRNECLRKVAMSGYLAACTQTDSERRRRDCFEAAVKPLENHEPCLALPQERQKALCLAAYGKTHDSAAACALIDDSALQSSCIDTLQQTFPKDIATDPDRKKDIEECGRIDDVVARDACFRKKLACSKMSVPAERVECLKVQGLADMRICMDPFLTETAQRECLQRDVPGYREVFTPKSPEDCKSLGRAAADFCLAKLTRKFGASVCSSSSSEHARSLCLVEAAFHSDNRTENVCSGLPETYRRYCAKRLVSKTSNLQMCGLLLDGNERKSCQKRVQGSRGQ